MCCPSIKCNHPASSKERACAAILNWRTLYLTLKTCFPPPPCYGAAPPALRQGSPPSLWCCPAVAPAFASPQAPPGRRLCFGAAPAAAAAGLPPLLWCCPAALTGCRLWVGARGAPLASSPRHRRASLQHRLPPRLATRPWAPCTRLRRRCPLACAYQPAPSVPLQGFLAWAPRELPGELQAMAAGAGRGGPGRGPARARAGRAQCSAGSSPERDQAPGGLRAPRATPPRGPSVAPPGPLAGSADARYPPRAQASPSATVRPACARRTGRDGPKPFRCAGVLGPVRPGVRGVRAFSVRGLHVEPPRDIAILQH